MAKTKGKKLRVALVFGGTSEERQVSLRTGRTIAEHIDTRKYDVVPIEIAKNGKWLLSSATIKQIGKAIPVEKIASTSEIIPVEEGTQGKIDVAFLALHGPGGEDGTIQGMLELLRIPYTCSGVLASALAMDKARTKWLVSMAGVPVLPNILIHQEDYPEAGAEILAEISGTVVIKPNHMGSSLGISIVSKRFARKAIEEAFKYDREVLIEPYIQGREITVPVLGNRDPEALPSVEIVPWRKSKFYDYAAKYEEGGSEHLIPASLTAKQDRDLKEWAITAHKALGCRGVTRSDFILDEKGQFYFLEINTIPGMTPTSLVPQSAQAAGISFSELLDRLIELAL